LLNPWQAEQLRCGRTRFHLKDYQIIDSLGQGGMGQVFKAEHSMMGRVVAIKVLPKDRSTPEAIASFQHEIRALAHLDHRNLVRAYDAGQDGNVHFLVTEFVPGTDLRRLVRSGGSLSQQDAATIISQAASGLEHAHGRGLLHRDVKPGNVMVTPDGQTKVLDLGLAGFLQEDVTHEDPRKGRIVGTADYLAPETIIAPSSVTPASDIYSLGCTLYYAVTRKVPFPGGKTADKCHRHVHEVPLNPRRFNDRLTDDFLDVLADMMEKDPAKRIDSAAEVVRRLGEWADQRVTATLPHVESNFARATPKAPPLPNDLVADTQEFPLPSSPAHESPSQASQGTLRDSHGGQETSPIDRPRPVPPRPGEHPEAPRSFPIWALLLLAGIPAVLLILAFFVGLWLMLS